MGNFTTRTNNMNQERFRRRPVKQMRVFVQTWNIFVLEQRDINRTRLHWWRRSDTYFHDTWRVVEAMSGVTNNTYIFNIYIDMDLDKTLRTEARIVLFAVSKNLSVCWVVLRCPLFITEARVKRGKHYLVRRREACIGQEWSNDNNHDKAGKMS